MICGYVMRVILDKIEQAFFFLVLMQNKYGYFCPPDNMSHSMYVHITYFIWVLLSE